MGRFFRWWGRELAALVPASLRVGERPSAAMHWIEFGQTAAVLWRLANAKRVELGRIDLTLDSAAQKLAFDTLGSQVGGKPLGISVAPAQALRRTVDLPLAARENLRQVLAFEMDRQTPFPAERLYFEHRVVGEDRQKNQFAVAFTAVPRQPVDEALAHLRAWEQAPHAVAVADELKGDGSYTNLLPVELRPKPQPWKKLLYVFMALSTLSLIAVLLAIPLWQKRETVIDLTAIVQRAERQANASNALKVSLEQAVARYNYLPEKKMKTPPRVALLEELSKMLPADTWLHQLDLHGTELQFQGETASSAKLIGLFEKSHYFADANFRSQLVKGQKGGKDRFQLVVTVKATPLAEALAEQAELAKSKGKPAKRNARKTAQAESTVAPPTVETSTAPASQPKGGARP